MKKLLSVLLLLSLTCPLFADPSLADIRKDIEDAYHKEDAALADGNAEDGLSYHTSDFIQVENGHSETLPEHELDLRNLLEDYKFKGTTTIVDLQLDDSGKAIVSISQHADLVSQHGRKKSMDCTAKDTWVKQGDVWRCSRSEILTDTTTDKK